MSYLRLLAGNARQGGYVRIGCCLCALIMLGVAVFSLSPAQASTSVEKETAVLCRLTAGDSVSYQVGPGGWVSQPAGAYPAVLPLQVRSGDSQCRVQVGPRSVIESAPESEFKIEMDKEKGLVLSLQKGSVLYSVPNDVRFHVQVASLGVSAVAGAASLPSGAKRSVEDFDIGVVTVASGKTPQVQVQNVRGLMSVREGKDDMRQVRVGESLASLQTPATPGNGAATTGTSNPGNAVVAAPARPFSMASAWRVTESSVAGAEAEVESTMAVSSIPPEKPSSVGPGWVWSRRNHKWEPRRPNSMTSPR